MTEPELRCALKHSDADHVGLTDQLAFPRLRNDVLGRTVFELLPVVRRQERVDVVQRLRSTVW